MSFSEITMRKTIKQSGTNESYKNHRGDFVTCPFCHHEKKNWDDWFELAVTLVLRPADYRAGAVAVWAECDKCFEQSWAHYNFDIFGRINRSKEFPKKWIEVVAEFARQTKIDAAEEWCQGLCRLCGKLETVDIGYNAYRSCEIGYGPPLTDCDKFKKK